MNHPITDPNADVFSIKVEARKHNTLLELKQKVSEVIGLNPNEFVLKKYGI